MACGNKNAGTRVTQLDSPATAQVVVPATTQVRAPATATSASQAVTVSPTAAAETTVAAAASTTAAQAAATTAVPVAVTARDFAFDVQASVAAGGQTFIVTNVGMQAHEMIIVHPDSGSLEQFKAGFTIPGSAPPSFTSIKALGALRSGASGQLSVTLTPGPYALLCFLPDPTTGALHAALGMVAGITVE